MNDQNGSRIYISTQKDSTINKAASLARKPTKNAKIKGDIRNCKYSTETPWTSQTDDNIEDAKGKKTACRCPCQPQPEYNSSSQLNTESVQHADMQYEKRKWLDCFVQGCQRESCFDGVDILPIEYSSPDKPCVPEYVHPCLPTDLGRRPQLPKPPEMLSSLKQGIRHPFQITHRRKEMQTHLDKLTDEHQAFAFPPGTRPFVDNNAYYFTYPASSLVENYDLVYRDVHMRWFPECAIRPSLLAFNGDRYKFFRERLPMPQKRVVDIPANRTLHWHNWIIRPLCTNYSGSWRKDIKVPDNWFGPAPSSVC